MVRTQVWTAYFHGVKTRLSTLWTDDVTCGSDFTRNSRPGLSTIEGHERTTGEAGIATTGVSLGCSEYYGISIWIALEIEVHIMPVLRHFALDDLSVP